jgi:hypothetical protein
MVHARYIPGNVDLFYGFSPSSRALDLQIVAQDIKKRCSGVYHQLSRVSIFF